MVHSFSRPHTSVALLDDGPDVVQSVTCPMCHARASLTQSALEAGGAWRCVRCGQHWDANRLTAVAAYAVWATLTGSPFATAATFRRSYSASSTSVSAPTPRVRCSRAADCHDPAFVSG